jgi:hypothetical protein
MANGNYPPFGFSFPVFHIPSPILGGSKHVFSGQILEFLKQNFFFEKFVEILVS